MNKIFIVSIFVLSSFAVTASSLSLDIGQTKAVYNRFAIPNTDKDRISLPVEDTLTSYRLTGHIDLASGNQVYFLFAPLSTSYSFISNKNFEFDNQNFSTGIKTDVNYKFSSYRIGYLWKWKLSRVHFWTGAVAKIRDAEIEVIQGNTTQSFDNIGFVPLVALGGEWLLFDALSIYSHTDALGASQGSAYDSQIEGRLRIGNFSLSIGKRFLGGGADNDNVYNFAQFDTTYTRISFFY